MRLSNFVSRRSNGIVYPEHDTPSKGRWGHYDLKKGFLLSMLRFGVELLCMFLLVFILVLQQFQKKYHNFINFIKQFPIVRPFASFSPNFAATVCVCVCECFCYVFTSTVCPILVTGKTIESNASVSLLCRRASYPYLHPGL